MKLPVDQRIDTYDPALQKHRDEKSITVDLMKRSWKN